MPLTQVSSRAIEDTLRYVLGASGTDHYTFTGKGLSGTVSDPTLTLSRGHTYIFENRNSNGAHPFYIKTSIANGGTNDAYNTGVTNNGGAGGTEIVFTVPHDAPDELYYQCSSHSNMAGELRIVSAVTSNSITTAKIADNAVVASHIASNSINTSKIADNAVVASHITDEAVTLAKLEHGTSSNDGKFLRANNGADPTFETVTSVGGATGVDFNDNVKARFGAANDLEIFHDGTDSIIKHQAGAGGDLILQSTDDDVFIKCNDDFIVNVEGGAENAIIARNNGAVELYQNGNKKCQTTAEGIQITESFKVTHGGNGVNLIQVHEAGVGNTASTTAQVPDCVGGGTVTVTVMHNGNTSITTTKMFPIMIRGSGSSNLGSEIFSINHLSTASFSVSAANRGITVTNNAGAHAKVRITFNITANFAVDT